MEPSLFFESIANVGFPIVCVVALGWFIYKSYDRIQKSNEKREEKLYTMLGKSQTQLDKLEDTNDKFVKVLESFKKDQDDIRHDVAEIKDTLKKIPKRRIDDIKEKEIKEDE